MKIQWKTDTNSKHMTNTKIDYIKGNKKQQRTSLFIPNLYLMMFENA